MSRKADTGKLSEHLPGQHDQRSHGRRGSSVFGTRQVEGVPIGKDAMPDGTHFNGYGPQNYHHVEYPGGEQSYGWYDRHAVRAERVPQSAKEKRSWGLKEGPHRDTVRAATEYLRGRTEHHGQEEMMAFDRDGRLIAHITGERDSVHPPPVVSMVAHTMLHTHPPKTGKATPSIEDAIYHNNYEVVTWGVVGPNDSVFFQRGGDPNGVRIRESKLSEHLPGKHDQRSHGRRGTGGPGGGADDFHDDKGTTRGYPYDDGNLKNLDPFKVMTEFPGRPMPSRDEKQGWHPDDMGPSARSVRRYAADIRGDSVENALIWDEKGQLLTWSKGNSDGVTPPSGASLRGHTMLHNHPSHDVEQLGLSSSGYGGSDLEYAAHYGVRKMVVTNKTGVFIAKLREGDSPDLWRTAQNTLVHRRYPVSPLSPTTAGESYSDRCMRVLKFHGIEVTRRVFSELREHLPGKHDQKTHGRGKGVYASESPYHHVADNGVVTTGWHKEPSEYAASQSEKDGWDKGPSERTLRRWQEAHRPTVEQAGEYLAYHIDQTMTGGRLLGAPKPSFREQAAIWDANGRQTFQGKGDISAIDPPKFQMTHAHTLVHTHPIDGGFSGGDLETAQAFNIRNMRVIGPRSTFTIRPKPGKPFGDPMTGESVGYTFERKLSEIRTLHGSSPAGMSWDAGQRYVAREKARAAAHPMGETGYTYDKALRETCRAHGLDLTIRYFGFEESARLAPTQTRLFDAVRRIREAATRFDTHAEALAYAEERDSYLDPLMAKAAKRIARVFQLQGEMLLSLMDGQRDRIELATLTEHLPGQHDQKQHGRRGTGPVTGDYARYGERYDTGVEVGDVYQYVPQYANFMNTYRVHTVPDTNVPPSVESKTALHPDKDGPSARSIRRVAAEIRSEEVENAVVWDEKGRLLTWSTGSPTSVDVPQGAAVMAHTMIHNHPRQPSEPGLDGLGLSGGDLHFAANHNIRKMVVVTPQGTVTARLAEGVSPTAWSRAGYKVHDLFNLPPTTSIAELSLGIMKEHGIQVTRRVFSDVREAAGELTALAEHLPGQHDQKSHGRRGSAGGGGSSEVITDITRELPEGFEWYHGINANTGVHTTGYLKKGLPEEGSPTFKGLDNRKLDDPDLQRKLDAVAEGIRNKTIEHSVQFDRDGNQISLTSGTELEVSPPSRASMAALVSMHNHPNDSPPSVQDFVHSTAYNHREVRIVGPTTSYTVRPGPSNPLWGDMASAYNERIERFRESNAWKNATENVQRYHMVEVALRGACEEQGFLLDIGHSGELPVRVVEALRTDSVERILRLLDVVEFDTKGMFESIVKDERTRARLLGRAMQYPTTGIGIAFDLPNPRAEEYATRRAAELVTRVNETTRADIRKMVTSAISTGQSWDSLARDLRRKYAEFGVKKPQHHIRDRATLIAVTELGQAYEQGVKDVGEYLASGGIPMMKFWQTVGDERRCPKCMGNEEAGWLRLEDEFPSGHDRPLAHPGCRCALLQRVYDPDDMPEAFRPEGYDQYMADYDHEAALANAYFVGKLEAPRYKTLERYERWVNRRAPHKLKLRSAPDLDSRAMQRDVSTVSKLWQKYPIRTLKEFGYAKMPANVACTYESGCLLLNESLSKKATARGADILLGRASRAGWWKQATTREHLIIRGFANAQHHEYTRTNPSLNLSEATHITYDQLRTALLGKSEPEKWSKLPARLGTYNDLVVFGTEFIAHYQGESLGAFGQTMGWLGAWQSGLLVDEMQLAYWYEMEDAPYLKFMFELLPGVLRSL